MSEEPARVEGSSPPGRGRRRGIGRPVRRERPAGEFIRGHPAEEAGVVHSIWGRVEAGGKFALPHAGEARVVVPADLPPHLPERIKQLVPRGGAGAVRYHRSRAWKKKVSASTPPTYLATGSPFRLK